MMHAIKFEEGKKYTLYGNEYHLILPREKTERLESELVQMKKGCKTPRHVHEDAEQVYVILEGCAELWIGEEMKEISEGMIAYIPRGATHRIRCNSENDLRYIYIACWPEGSVPPTRTPEEMESYERKLLSGDKG